MLQPHRRDPGILGIPQSAEVIDDALSLTPGLRINEEPGGHKSDPPGSAHRQLLNYTHTFTKTPVNAEQTALYTLAALIGGGLKITGDNLVLNLSIGARFGNKERCRGTTLEPFLFVSLCLSGSGSSRSRSLL